ncbi:MAG: hypothetical protein LBH05_01615 [Deferribacteraceae bacterium]|jgi:hypothetical protein|nr:hypothetical protein [Deferribacteraceae bacterium]
MSKNSIKDNSGVIKISPVTHERAAKIGALLAKAIYKIPIKMLIEYMPILEEIISFAEDTVPAAPMTIRAMDGEYYRSGEHWITLKNGKHILINENGSIISGLGGKYNGQNVSEINKATKHQMTEGCQQPSADLLSSFIKEQRLLMKKFAFAQPKLQPSKNFAELKPQLEKVLSPFMHNSGGQVHIYEYSNNRSMMVSDGKGEGRIGISVAKQTIDNETQIGLFKEESYFPDKTLLSACNKIANKEELTALEEYMIVALWHEIGGHNRHKTTPKPDLDEDKLIYIETITEWIARHTYDTFLNYLGGQAQYQEKIKELGLGYYKEVEYFDNKRNNLNINEEEMYQELMHITKNHEYIDYKKELDIFFAKKRLGVK